MKTSAFPRIVEPSQDQENGARVNIPTLCFQAISIGPLAMLQVLFLGDATSLAFLIRGESSLWHQSTCHDVEILAGNIRLLSITAGDLAYSSSIYKFTPHILQHVSEIHSLNHVVDGQKHVQVPLFLCFM